MDISKFSKSKNVKDGYENSCKECRKNNRKKYKLNCEECNKEFISICKKTRFCSGKCSSTYKNKDKRIYTHCSYCKKDILIPKSKFKKFSKFYCNQKCRKEHLRILMHGDKNPNYNRIDYICDGCGINIKVIPSRLEKQKYIFCSKDCYKQNIGKFFGGENNPNYNHQEFSCYECGKKFLRKPSQNRGKRFYCSRECYDKVNKNKPRKCRITLKCSYCKMNVEVWKSRLNYIKDVYCSVNCANKGFSIKYRGANSSCYNPNLTDEERINARHTPEYNEWRKKVFKRDNYTCQCCKDNSGGNLRAHHYINYSENKELQLNIDNGICLCNTCHVSFHNKYGYKNNTKKQLVEYIKFYQV